MALNGIEALRDNSHDTELFARVWNALRKPDEPMEAQDQRLVTALTKIALLDKPTRTLVTAVRTVLEDESSRAERSRPIDWASPLLDSMLEERGLYCSYAPVRVTPPVVPGVGRRRTGVSVRAEYGPGAVAGVAISERIFDTLYCVDYDVPLIAGESADPIGIRTINDAERLRMSRIATYALDLPQE